MNKNTKVGKRELCKWTYKALQCALTPKNIQPGFRKAGIWPLDRSAATYAMRPSSRFGMDEGGGCETVCSVQSGSESPCRVAPDMPTQYPHPGRDQARPIPGRERSPSERTGWKASEQGRGDDSPSERREREGSLSQATSDTDGEAPGACNDVDANVHMDSLVPSDEDHHGSDVCPCHYYIDVSHAEESTYGVYERNIPIDPEFHANLEQHSNNFSQFPALPEVIPARKKKKQQPLLDFLKSRILMSLAYTQACEEVLAQKTAREAEAWRKLAKTEANRESRIKEKEERQREVQQRAEV